MTHYTQNMAYFEAHKPALAKLLKNANVERYRYEKNEHGADDIFDVRAGRFLYGVDQAGLMDMARRSVDSLHFVFAVQPNFLGKIEDWYRVISPISARLWEEMYECGPFSRGGSAHVVDGYKPFVRMYGIGLGLEVPVLFSRGAIKYFTLFEPDVELFACSLHRVPWYLLHSYFEKQYGAMELFVGDGPAVYCEKSHVWLHDKFRYLAESQMVMSCRQDEEIATAMRMDVAEDVVLVLNAHLGWYEDQRAGFFYSIKSQCKRFPVYMGGKMPRKSRVFIVGSGPSLSECIDFIKANRECAVVFSSGSALFTLLENGILPDFSFQLERFVADFEEKLPDVSILKRIHSVKMNAVSDSPSRYYKSTMMLLKANEPGSGLFADCYPLVPDTNPTVTNMAVAFAGQLKPEEVWLFGCDYGRHEDYSTYHNKGGYYKVLDEEHGIKEPVLDADDSHIYDGALGGRVFSDNWLLQSRAVAESVILKSQEIRWIRVGHGALIRGVQAKSSEQIKRKRLSRVDRGALVASVLATANADYADNMDMSGLPNLLALQMDEYLESFSGFFHIKPGSKSAIIDVLDNMTRAADIAKGERHPAAQLLAGSIMLFAQNLFMQIALSEDDADAARVFECAMNCFHAFLHTCRDDAIRIADGALNGVAEIPFMTVLGRMIGGQTDGNDV